MITRTDDKTPLALFGLGNELLSDDGLGLHALRALEPRAGLKLIEVGSRGLEAMAELESCRQALLVDAVRAGGRPGTVYRFSASDAAERSDLSLHDAGLLRALYLLPEGKRPRAEIIGMEPMTLDYGLDLSPCLREELPQFVAILNDEIERRLAALLPDAESKERLPC